MQVHFSLWHWKISEFPGQISKSEIADCFQTLYELNLPQKEMNISAQYEKYQQQYFWLFFFLFWNHFTSSWFTISHCRPAQTELSPSKPILFFFTPFFLKFFASLLFSIIKIQTFVLSFCCFYSFFFEVEKNSLPSIGKRIFFLCYSSFIARCFNLFVKQRWKIQTILLKQRIVFKFLIVIEVRKWGNNSRMSSWCLNLKKYRNNNKKHTTKGKMVKISLWYICKLSQCLHEGHIFNNISVMHLSDLFFHRWMHTRKSIYVIAIFRFCW